MYSVLVILAVIVAILLVFIVSIQESKGGGLASNFSASNQIMGVRKTTDVVEKATWTLAGVLVVISVATIFFAPRQSYKLIRRNGHKGCTYSTCSSCYSRSSCSSCCSC